MLIPYYNQEPPAYEPYRKQKFEKSKNKIINVLRGVDSLSLKGGDKKKLINEIKKILANF